MNAPTYVLLSVGVNRTPSATKLAYAERDAVRIGLAVTSAKGAIAPSHAKYLLGSTTIRDLDHAFDQIAKLRPTFFMFHFGGHGNADGIGLADGLYPYRRIKKRLAAIGAHATIVTLDCCGAGGMFKSGTALGGTLEPVAAAWVAALLASTPGVRVFAAADVDESTYESSRFGGWFVDALVKGMFDTRPGDLPDDGGEFVSDRRVFSRAKAIMESRGVTPIAHGPFGNFPIMLSNTSKVGLVTLKAKRLANLGLAVEATARDRRHLVTRIVATPTDGLRNVLPSETAAFIPMSDQHTHNARFQVDLGISPGCRQQMWQYGVCRVIWELVALDAENRVVGSRREIVDYETGRLSAYWR